MGLFQQEKKSELMELGESCGQSTETRVHLGVLYQILGWDPKVCISKVSGCWPGSMLPEWQGLEHRLQSQADRV